MTDDEPFKEDFSKRASRFSVSCKACSSTDIQVYEDDDRAIFFECKACGQKEDVYYHSVGWINEGQELQMEIVELFMEFDKTLLEIMEPRASYMAIAGEKRREIIEHELSWRKEVSERAAHALLKRHGVDVSKIEKPARIS